MFGNVLPVLEYKYITLKKRGSPSLTRNLTNLRSPFFCWKPRRSKMPRNVSPPGGSWLRDFSIKYTHSFLLSSNCWSCQHSKAKTKSRQGDVQWWIFYLLPKVSKIPTRCCFVVRFEILYQHEKKLRKFIQCDLNLQRSLRNTHLENALLRKRWWQAFRLYLGKCADKLPRWTLPSRWTLLWYPQRQTPFAIPAQLITTGCL